MGEERERERDYFVIWGREIEREKGIYRERGVKGMGGGGGAPTQGSPRVGYKKKGRTQKIDTTTLFSLIPSVFFILFTDIILVSMT